MDNLETKKNRIIILSYYAIVFLYVLFITYVLKNYMMAFVYCLIIVFILQSLLSYLEMKNMIHTKVSRVVVCLFVYIIIFGSISVFCYFISNRFLSFFSLFYHQLEQINSSNFLIIKIIQYFQVNENLIMETCITMIHRTVTIVPTLFFNMFFVVFSSFLLVFDYYEYKRKFVVLLGDSYQSLFFIISSVRSVLLIYIKVYIKLGIILFIEMVVGFSFFNIQPAFFYAFIFSFFDLIPLIGVELIFIPWILFLFLEGKIFLAIQLLLLYSIMFCTKQWIETKGMAEYSGVPMGYLFIGVYLSVRFFGLLGVFIGPVLCIIIFEIYIKGNKNE